MSINTMIEKLTWKTKAIFAISAVLGIWMMRAPLIREMFPEDNQIINQLKANVKQQKINTSHNELETELTKQSRSFRRIGTLI